MTKKINLLPKIFPMYNPQRYKTLSTFKKENIKMVGQVASPIPNRSLNNQV
jgi:hypothetical protein